MATPWFRMVFLSRDAQPCSYTLLYDGDAMRSKSDEELMALYQQDNEAAFQELHVRYERLLEAYIANILRGLVPAMLGETRDILQNVFTWVHTNRHRFQTGTVKPWLFATAHRLTFNYLKHESVQQRDYRRASSLVPEEDDFRGSYTAPEEQHSRRNALAFAEPQETCSIQVREEVEDCLSSLAPRHREIVRLLYFEGYTAQEAADKLGVPKTTVDWYKREALAIMRKTKDDSG
jgi:RNA polymerase sigma-70 factor (ECF subfamily)